MITGINDNLPGLTATAAPAKAAPSAPAEAPAALPTDSMVKSEASGNKVIPRNIFLSRDPALTKSAPTPEAARTEGVLNTEAIAPRSGNSWLDKWGPQVIYFPLTDRFSDGDPTNNMGVDKSNPLAYHGGDLRGVINKLDYIKDLGATTIWVAPMYDNTDRVEFGDYKASGYHGYWIRDHYQVDEHQGTMDTAKELVQKAHEKDMKVVMDVVLNHVAPNHPWTQDPSKHDWFHHNGGIQNWDDPWQLENRDVCGLPDLNQSNPETYQYLLDNTLWWIKETGVDGIRLDAVKHIDHGFWQKFSADIKAKMGDDFMILGEVLHGDPNVQASYQRDGLDALFDMPLYYTMRDTFAKDGSARKLGDRLAEDCKYQDPYKMVTLLDNHDFERFMYHTGGNRGEDKLMLGMSFIMTCRGIPSVYYGTEVGMQGGGDPDNRRDMEFGKNPQITQHMQKLTSIRAGLPALQVGHQLEMWQDDQVYSFCRRHEGQEVITVVNNSYDTQTRNIPLRDQSPIHDGDVLVDALTGEKFTVQNNSVNVWTADKKARILVPEQFMKDIHFKN